MIDPAEFQWAVLSALRDILPIAMGILFSAQEREIPGIMDAEIHHLEEHCNTINTMLKTLEGKDYKLRGFLRFLIDD